jgi:hypothetical protein
MALKTSSKSGLFLIELIVVILFFLNRFRYLYFAFCSGKAYQHRQHTAYNGGGALSKRSEALKVSKGDAK